MLTFVRGKFLIDNFVASFFFFPEVSRRMIGRGNSSTGWNRLAEWNCLIRELDGDLAPIVPYDANTRLVIFSARFCADCSARKLVRSLAAGREIASLCGRDLYLRVAGERPVVLDGDRRNEHEFGTPVRFILGERFSETSGSINYARRRGSSGRMDRRRPLFLEPR